MTDKLTNAIAMEKERGNKERQVIAEELAREKETSARERQVIADELAKEKEASAKNKLVMEERMARQEELVESMQNKMQTMMKTFMEKMEGSESPDHRPRKVQNTNITPKHRTQQEEGSQLHLNKLQRNLYGGESDNHLGAEETHRSSDSADNPDKDDQMGEPPLDNAPSTGIAGMQC
jgi:hypothetical protein